MRQVKAGSADISVYIQIIDSTDGTPETGVTSATGGLALEYVRNGAATASITESDLATTSSAHSDGGMKHLGYGTYRLDLPDAAVAAGVDTVEIIGTVTGMIVLPTTLQLVGYDPRSELTTAVLARIDENVSAAKTLTSGERTSIGTAVWASTTRTLSSFGTLVADVWASATRTITGGTITTNSDKTGYTVSTVSDKTGYALSSAGVQAIWDALGSALTTVGSIGKLIVDNLNAAVGSIASAATIADAVWDEAIAGHLTAGSTGATLNSASAPSAAAVADAVWDEAISGHLTAGSTGAKLNTASGAAGSGNLTHVYTLTSTAGGAPISDADVDVYTEEACINLIASGRTDTFGNVTFYPNAGTYWLIRVAEGFSFDPNPIAESVP